MADHTTEIYKAVAQMTDSGSRNRSHTYRFDVSVRMGSSSPGIRPKRTFANHSKKLCVLLMPEFISIDWTIAPSPTMCLTRVLRRFQDMCTSVKRHVCTNLLSGLGYLKIESTEKLNGRLICPAKMGTGTCLEATSAHQEHLCCLSWQHPTPRGLGGQQLCG